MTLSGAYWKNDKDNKMLTRINGIAFRNNDELQDYLKLLEEAVLAITKVVFGIANIVVIQKKQNQLLST